MTNATSNARAQLKKMTAAATAFQDWELAEAGIDMAGAAMDFFGGEGNAASEAAKDANAAAKTAGVLSKLWENMKSAIERLAATALRLYFHGPLYRGSFSLWSFATAFYHLKNIKTFYNLGKAVKAKDALEKLIDGRNLPQPCASKARNETNYTCVTDDVTSALSQQMALKLLFVFGDFEHLEHLECSH